MQDRRRNRRRFPSPRRGGVRSRPGRTGYPVSSFSPAIRRIRCQVRVITRGRVIKGQKSSARRCGERLPLSGNLAADDPLDLGADQTFHHRGQVHVQPFLQQRPQFGAHHVLQRRAAAINLRRASRRQSSDQAANRGCGGGSGFRRNQIRCRRRWFPGIGTVEQASRPASPGGSGRLGGGHVPAVKRRRHRVRKPSGSASAAATAGFRRGHHHGLVQHQHIVVRRAASAGSAGSAGTSSSFRIRRMEARISSIDGSAPSRCGWRGRLVCHSRAIVSGPAGWWRSRPGRPIYP